MCELGEGRGAEITLKPQSGENGQQRKFPGPTPETSHVCSTIPLFTRPFWVQCVKDVSPAVVVLNRVTMYQQRSSNSIIILSGLQYTNSVVTKLIQLYTRTTGKQEHLDQYI